MGVTGRIWTTLSAGMLMLGLGAGQGHAAGGAASLLDWIGSNIAAEDAVLAPARIEPVWIDSEMVLVPEARGSLAIDLVDVRSGTRRRLTDPEALFAALRARGLDPAAIRARGLDPEGLQLSDGRQWFRLKAGAFEPAPDLALKAQRDMPQLIASQFPTTFDDLVELPAPDGSRFLTLQGHDLAMRRRDGVIALVTRGGTADLTWRSSEESEQDFPAVWSPDGKLIAAVRLDLRGVPHEPVMRWLATPPLVDRIPYPRAGEPMPRFSVALISPDGIAEPRFLDLGDTTDHYVNIIDFTRDGRQLLVQVIDRAHHHWRLFGVDVATGAANLLLEEQRSTYIDTPMTLAPVLVRVVDGGFLHLSEESGYRHIVLRGADGRQVRQLTSGRFVVEDIVAIDHKRGWVYFLADTTPSTVLNPRLHRVRLTGGAVAAFGGKGVEKLWFAPDLRHVVIRGSTTTSPPVTELVSLDRGNSTALSGPATPELAALPQGIPISTQSADGLRQVHGVLYLPPGAKVPVPVVEIIYGGMQLDFMPRHWFGFGRLEGGYNGMIARLLLAHGYAVGYINAPGTPNRGRDYQDATYGTWPQSVIPDHVAWWRAAARHSPEIDLTRLGVFGNSWGGFLAQRAMIDAPGLYRAAVAMSPPSDLVDHPNYIEPFMGRPGENPDGYAKASNLARIGAVKGPVLVMPMPLDVNAGFSPGMKFVDAMIAAGKNVEIFTIPEVNHRVNCCGPVRERYAYATVIHFFDRKLND